MGYELRRECGGILLKWVHGLVTGMETMAADEKVKIISSAAMAMRASDPQIPDYEDYY